MPRESQGNNSSLEAKRRKGCYRKESSRCSPEDWKESNCRSTARYVVTLFELPWVNKLLGKTCEKKKKTLSGSSYFILKKNFRCESKKNSRFSGTREITWYQYKLLLQVPDKLKIFRKQQNKDVTVLSWSLYWGNWGNFGLANKQTNKKKNEIDIPYCEETS